MTTTNIEHNSSCIATHKSTDSFNEHLHNIPSRISIPQVGEYSNLEKMHQRLDQHIEPSSKLQSDNKENITKFHVSSPLSESRHSDGILTPIVLARVKDMEMPITTPMTCLKRLSRLSSPEQSPPSLIDGSSFEFPDSKSFRLLNHLGTSNIDSFMEEHFQASQKMSFRRKELINSLIKPLADEKVTEPNTIKTIKETASVPLSTKKSSNTGKKILNRMWNVTKTSVLILIFVFSLFLVDFSLCMIFALWTRDLEFVIVVSSSYYYYYTYYLNHGLVVGLIRSIVSNSFYEYDKSIPY